MKRFDGYTLVRWPTSGSTVYRLKWTQAHYVEVLKGALAPTTVCHIEVNPERERVYEIPTRDICRNCLK